MEWVFWILHSVSVYEKHVYNSFRQSFCTHSMSFDNFLSNHDAKQETHIQVQSMQ